MASLASPCLPQHAHAPRGHATRRRQYMTSMVYIMPHRQGEACPWARATLNSASHARVVRRAAASPGDRGGVQGLAFPPEVAILLPVSNLIIQSVGVSSSCAG